MGIVLGLTWMTVTGTAGALGVSCWLADLTSVQPTPQSSQSAKATANEYHARLVRLSVFITIFLLDSLVAYVYPVGGRYRTMPTEADLSVLLSTAGDLPMRSTDEVY